MERTVLHVVLSDSTKAVWGAMLFLACSVGVGLLTYVVVRRFASMRCREGNAENGRRSGVVFGTLMSLVTLLVFYASSLTGFYDLQVRGDHIVLHYLFPERYVTYQAMNVLKVDKEPAFKSNWRLVVHDIDGGVYQSALSTQQDVQQALTALKPVMDPESAPLP